MNSSASDEPTPSDHSTATPGADHPDPITGEPGAHPVGVGIGAAGAGLAGAAIGAVIGPIGVLIGAALGAVAGGLAGKEVAEADDDPSVARESDTSTASTAETVLPAAGMAGLSAGGVPAATLTALPRGVSYDGNPETATEEESGAMGAAGPFGVSAGVGAFHDHLTASTVQETMEENRLTGEDEINVGQEEAIRTAAYFRYLDRQVTGHDGDELNDWLSAENEITGS